VLRLQYVQQRYQLIKAHLGIGTASISIGTLYLGTILLLIHHAHRIRLSSMLWAHIDRNML